MKLPPLWKPGLQWLILLGPLFFVSYGFANRWAAAQSSVDSIVFAWEKHVPFLPWTIVPYWSIDLLYGWSLLVCAQRIELARHARRLLTAQLICIGSFLLFPLQFSTARPPVDGWAGHLFDALTAFDLPFNQAPSLHIVLLVILWDFYRRRLHGVGKFLLQLWSGLIGISVLTTFQHHFIDIPTGLLVGVFCLWLWPLDGAIPSWRWAKSTKRHRLAGMYAAAALAIFLMAGAGRSWWWLYWPATSLVMVALCYAALGEHGFQKRPDGRHSVASRVLLWPYQLAAWVNARWWTRAIPSSSLVCGGVWLGRAPLPWEPDHQRFAQIIDLAGELSVRHPGCRAHGWLDLTEPTPRMLVSAALAVEKAQGAGPVLVCCALGFSRSAAVTAAWLCIHGQHPSVDSALQLIRLRRPQIVVKPQLRSVIDEAINLARAPS